MAYQLADFAVLDFGYISGANLLQWCPLPLLNQQLANGIDFNLCLQTAQTEIISELSNQYDFTAEYLKKFPSGDPLPKDIRERLVLEMTTILTIRTILGAGTSITENLRYHFDRTDKNIEKIKLRSKKLNMPVAVRTELANTRLVHARFTSETDFPGWPNKQKWI